MKKLTRRDALKGAIAAAVSSALPIRAICLGDELPDIAPEIETDRDTGPDSPDNADISSDSISSSSDSSGTTPASVWSWSGTAWVLVWSQIENPREPFGPGNFPGDSRQLRG